MDNEKIIQKLFEHDARFDRLEAQMATKKDVGQIFDTLDKAMVILQRLDQERIFTNERIKRIETDLLSQQKELKQIKRVLNIS